MIKLEHGFSLVDFAHKVKELDYESLKNEGYLYDRYDGYLHWRDGSLNIINWLDIESDPLIKIMRVTRTFYKNNNNSFTNQDEQNLIHLIKEAKIQNPLQMTRGFLKILGDENAAKELSILQKLGFFEKWLPQFKELPLSEIDFSDIKELDYGRDDRLALAKLHFLIKQFPNQTDRLNAIFTVLYPFDPATAISWLHEELTGKLLQLERIDHISQKKLDRISKSTLLSSKEKEDLLQKEIQGHWQNRKGVISGVFNPVHRGHLEFFHEAIDEMILDELIIIPNEGELIYENPISLEHRWQMLKLLEDEVDELRIISKEYLPVQGSDVNALVSSLIQKDSEANWTRIMGSDVFERYVKDRSINNEIADNILVIQRDQEQFYSIDDEISAKIYYKPHVATTYSYQKLHQAKNARKMAKKGKSPSEYVPDVVAEYIISESLYQEKFPLNVVTTNAEEQKKFSEIIPDVNQISLDIPLTDWSDPKSAVQHKLKEAKKSGIFPVIVIEDFINISALSKNHYFPISDPTISLIGNENLALFLENKEDAKASMLSIVGYAHDENKTKIIKQVTEGVISLEILKQNGSTLKDAFIPNNDENKIEKFMQNLKVKKLGFMTGVFNPIHLGHLDSLNTAKEAASLDKVIIIPTPATNHNETPIQWEERQKMVQLAIESSEGFEAIPNYYKKWLDKGTGVALEHLKSEYPNAKFFHIMGSDSFDRFREKKFLDELDDKNSIIVIQRKGHEILVSENNPHITILDIENNIGTEERASSTIRDHLKEGKPISHLVPQSVEIYIRDKDPYSP